MRSPLPLWMLPLLAASACRTPDKSSLDTGPLEDPGPETDLDGDGFTTDEDCDDNSALVNPSAAEICDGVDNNCDGAADEGVTSSFYADTDGDGFGDEASLAEACEAPQGHVSVGNDCDDTDADSHPGAAERCDDLDNDCDGSVDEEVRTEWYADADADGYGDIGSASAACDPPAGYVDNADDCDDTDGSALPGGVEVCDEADNDCDGTTDEEVTTTFYQDVDGDGFGVADITTESCDPPTGYTASPGDCDDTDRATSPAAAELCDLLDNDCDGTVDEDDAADALTWYRDADSDGYGDETSTTDACYLPTGYIDNADDCNDARDDASPADVEVCDSIDNDCDGTADEDDASDAPSWYADNDGDGYGGTSSTQACSRPSGFADNADDCNDARADASPADVEVCDSIDNDCDGTADEDDASDASVWYADDDGDGYGDPAERTGACEPPSGHVENDDDCDDTDALSAPGGVEYRDGQDNDCDGSADEALWRGTGADGALTVTGTTDLHADGSHGRAEPDAVAYVVSAISGATVTLAEDADGLDTGDEVLIINLHGSDSAYAAAGTYELASVASVSGDEVTLMRAVAEVFGQASNGDLSGQAVVLQRVPNYTDVDIAAGGLLTGTPWDGERYGIVAFRASGTVDIADGGAVSADSLGYWGGATGSCDNCDAFQGESYAGLGDGDYYAGPYNESNGAYAANYGGGGANVTGGGGEHAGGASAGDSWNGGGYTAPRAGSTYGAADLSILLFGSGGGGVWNGGYDTTGEDPGPGGDGGGIILIGAGAIEADGPDAITAFGGSTTHWASGTWTYGAAGGAGGSIHLAADTLTLDVDSVGAAGGLGQAGYIRAGGDGGVGRIRLDFGTLNGDAQGTSAADAEITSTCDPDAGYDGAP